ncbi:ankyrin repeat-containing domain protein [Lasiosphaeria ovina]|uniref:Ankyrin repeat-containing domain protein n=1 Tax=Lasiosphaeria ovina TaxID=92902 RepID=A0AAE0TWU5_9PEZI|nr:ankyrin repeat-containing domain protein [Lasiosphaeria ovina]
MAGGFKLQDKNESDISSFINAQWELAVVPSDPGAMMIHIKQALIQKADGVFLRARLALQGVVAAIEDGATVEELQDAINEIPSQLSGVFSMLLGQVEAKCMKECHKMLAIVFTAVRPLTLREFRLAMALSGDETFSTHAELEASTKVSKDDEVIALRTRSRCGGLLEIAANTDPWPPNTTMHLGVGSRSNGVVRFIHQSIKDFLTAQSKDPGLNLPTPEQLMVIGNVTLSKSCLRYICLRETNDGSRRLNTASLMGNDPTISHEFPLLKYAVENWFKHSEMAEKLGCTQTDDILSLLGPASSAIERWCQLIGHFVPYTSKPQDYTLLQLAVETNLGNLVEKICQQDGFDVNEWTDDDGCSYLMIAILRGNLDSVKALIAHGANCNYRDTNGHSTLLTASKKASLDSRDVQSRTALDCTTSSSSPDSGDCLNALIEWGFSVNDRDDAGMTPLHHVLYSYDLLDYSIYDPDVSLANIKLLLRRGAEIDAQDAEGNTALHLAARMGELRIVKWLLKEGADPLRTNNNGRRPYILAALDEVRAILEPKSSYKPIDLCN